MPTARSNIVYPAVPPVPDAPVLTEAVNGSLGARTEYYILTYVTPYGESFAGVEGSLAVDANNVVLVAPPDYPYPFPVYGYNVYAATSSGGEVLQNSTPVLPGDTWTEPATGLITGGAVPPTTWSATTLTFGPQSYATKIPFRDRASVRHKNVAASGVLETIYEHTDYYIDFTVEVVQLGDDITGWDSFVAFAERGGIFSFYPDFSIGGGGSGFTNYTLDDTEWKAAYKSAGYYTFKMKWREATGASGGSGGSIVSTLNFADNIAPTDSGDHQNFTLPFAPNPAGSLMLVLKGTNYYNQPLIQGAGGDYTLSGLNIALNNPLSGTWQLRAWFRFTP